MLWIRVDLIAGRQHQQVDGVVRTICGIYAVLGDARNRFDDQLNLAGIHCLEKVARQDGAPRKDAVTGHQRLAQLRILAGSKGSRWNSTNSTMSMDTAIDALMIVSINGALSIR
ncbi:Uncharacterised protein [Mycobacteroides abscessus subsp. massiliense]|nr:Uncharacterised protein [Mycobacteroides abscessus subsp. massiliense]